MKPLGNDLEYAADQSHDVASRARFNWLYIIPGLGTLWLLFLASAALFQWPVSGVVDPVMSIMLVLFFVMAGLLFWALAPKANRE